MTESSTPILPGATVQVNDSRSIYKGYTGFVQRVSGDQAAVLFEGGNWDKLITIPIKHLQLI
ncbi:NAD(P)H dehydrogenase subunit NdhS [Prochlorococcus sp. MIT 1307]|uniref:NAD(P)H dehydrogenase subunit NdhS n=1 Tax=Prochlorococcus sp. MIT 1307 TaxID=3096219 RepID=UPI002A74F9E0|nr:NAD(P)H dehydrogenase subunit NdhS [Prochlorococcus sp. MIT 1307]